MLILLIGLAFLITSYSTYAFAYQINGINRVVATTPVTIFETSILHNVSDDEAEVLFNKETVKNKLENYYEIQLSKFTNKFSYEIYFYNKLNGSMCIEDACNAVEVTFNASLLFDYKYHKTLNYEVLNNGYGS